MEMICPRCLKLRIPSDFHLSGGTICARCFYETNPEKFPSDTSQPRWIEAPANYRCYVVPEHVFITDFETLDENGQPYGEGHKIGLIIRKRDGKRFKPASWIPAYLGEHERMLLGGERVRYLEEV